MKNHFIKSTFILLIGGFISKIMGMIIKIYLTRSIKDNGISLYMLILPTFNLFITLCTFGFPLAISKIVSEHKYSSKRIILPIVPLCLAFNLFLILFLFISSPFISRYLLHNSNTYYPLLSIGFTLPFICISGIIKGYFVGKEMFFPSTISSLIEQVVRFILIVYAVPLILDKNISYVVSFVVLINVISELSGIFVLLFFLPHHDKVKFKDFSFNSFSFKKLINISVPITGSRLIGSFSYFLEPIIITFILLKLGYSNDYIVNEYGIINGYVYPLLILPSFFTGAISSALLPVISNLYSKNKISECRNKIFESIVLSLFIGIPLSLFFYFFPNLLLSFIYNTNKGASYVKYLSPFFLIYYIEGPFTASMQAMGLSKEIFQGTLVASLLRISSLSICCLLNFGLLSLPISTIINIMYISIHHFIYLKKYLG